MTEPHKKVNNSLFSSAVTGGTFEEFSQNALLLPAMEKPQAPTLNITPDTQVHSNLEESSSAANFFLEQVDLQEAPQQSNLSSVFSSFSNVLKIRAPREEELPPPSFTIPENPNAPPVPLFTPTGVPPLTSAPERTRLTNSYRRGGLKRPVYAQISGLSHQKPPPPPHVFPPVPSVESPEYFRPVNNPFLPEFTPEASTLPPGPISTSQSVFTEIIGEPALSGFAPNPQQSIMSSNAMSQLMQPSNVDTIVPPSTTPTMPVSVIANQVYRPIYHHWFQRKEIEGKSVWQPFSMVDSLALEASFMSNDLDPDKVVATDGGRFDVNILRRQRSPVYWEGPATEVRRCSWFHKHTDGRYVPYEENIATKLEEEFKIAFEANQWHHKVELANGETIVFHAPDILVLFPVTQSPDAWGNSHNQPKSRIVKRGMDEFDIDEGESATVDHLLFLVHGIGSVCDLKFRKVEEVVDDFRSISLQLVQSHYKSSCDQGLVHRVEVLPISWHDALHSGIDAKLKSITLESIPRLRGFTNDTLLDILFYTSPMYCATIVSAVGNELNRIYTLFQERNPEFNGGISLGGHSLGSLVLFDLLCHQRNESEVKTSDEDSVAVLNDPKPAPLQRQMSRSVSYMVGNAGTGQPQIQYPMLNFHPKNFFALGSPIGMFVTVRGLDTLGEEFTLPTCPGFFNIFHPYDPVAYRIESLINPDLANVKPVLIPHHKGRKRMHLELKETMARVGADLKQRIIDSMKSTWNSFYQLAAFHRQDSVALEAEVSQVLQQQQLNTVQETEDEPEEVTNLSLGKLNNNRRVDYVLQEAPFEIFNEYLFALSSHVCYWDSEDTMLLILKEIYSAKNITADDKIPQQTMSIERPVMDLPKPQENVFGMDPTMPIQSNRNIGPPPISGFVKKT